MNDSYDGPDSGETTETTVESGTESTGQEAGGAETITDSEVASAFDENNGSETKTEGEVAGNKETAGLSEPATAPEVNTGKNGLAETEPAKPEATSAKPETATAKPEATETTAGEKAENSETIHVTCTREDLAGKNHPETGVPYETKVVEVNGKQLEVTVPKFDSKFDFKLDENQLQLSRQKHNSICNEKLQEKCNADPEWASQNFSQKQLDQIRSGKNPKGYTWHHDGGEVGHMQLVDSKVHNDTRHTGGIAIWGNSSKYT